jgi:hypothetical protein
MKIATEIFYLTPISAIANDLYYMSLFSNYRIIM